LAKVTSLAPRSTRYMCAATELHRLLFQSCSYISSLNVEDNCPQILSFLLTVNSPLPLSVLCQPGQTCCCAGFQVDIATDTRCQQISYAAAEEMWRDKTHGTPVHSFSPTCTVNRVALLQCVVTSEGRNRSNECHDSGLCMELRCNSASLLRDPTKTPKHAWVGNTLVTVPACSFRYCF
jgi:hypothetical protein